MEYHLNLKHAHAKMEEKNAILPPLQEKFEAALTEGKILSFEEIIAGAEGWLASLGKELNA